MSCSYFSTFVQRNPKATLRLVFVEPLVMRKRKLDENHDSRGCSGIRMCMV